MMPSQFKRLSRWRSIQSFGVPFPYFSSIPGCRIALAIVERALEDDVAKSFHQRAMRIAFAISERVMLAVAGNPFLGHDGGGEPQPEPHWKRGEIVKTEAAMRLRAVKEQRDTYVRDMTRYHDEKNGHPPSSCPHAKTWHCRNSENQKEVRSTEP